MNVIRAKEGRATLWENNMLKVTQEKRVNFYPSFTEIMLIYDKTLIKLSEFI